MIYRPRRPESPYQLDRLLWHVVDDNEVDFADIETFLSDRRRNEDIEDAFLELRNGLRFRGKFSMVWRDSPVSAPSA